VHNLEAQKRFITNASHELKTPLAIISVNAEAIEMMNGKNDWTEGILKQVRHLSNLINHLILLSKASEMSRLQLKIGPLDVKKLLSAAASEFDLLVKDGGKKLAVSCPEGLKGMSDWKCMNELIHIFLDNAVKYCDKGGTISVSAAGTKKNVTVSVTNDYKEGEGVDYSRFFERFYRNDESHNSEKAGYGIGLSIAGELSSLLQAPLSVSYKDGKITFSITMKAG
jgi:two-component system sensor histidine kinase CiaH